MRIGIIGAGGAGLASAWLLQSRHDVTVYEREPHFGGHAHSVAVEHQGKTVYAETGFKFFFDPVYPTLLALLRILDVRARRCTFSSTVLRRDRGEVLKLPPRRPSEYLRLLQAPGTLRDFYWLLRLMRSSREFVARADWSLTLRQYCAAQGIPESAQYGLIYPHIAANWGAPAWIMPDFPAYTVLKVLAQKDITAPVIFELERGISTYIDALVTRLTRTELRADAEVRRVTSQGGKFLVDDARGERREFDHLVVAGSSREAARALEGLAEAAELRRVIAEFTHFDTTIAVHQDPSFMPPRRRDWSLLNVFLDGTDTWQTEWSGWRQRVPVFRTWLPRDGRMPRDPILVKHFHHLVVTPENRARQERLAALQGRRGVSAVGMYTTDVDNHESTLKSALALAERLAPESPELRRWRAEREVETTRRYEPSGPVAAYAP